MVLPTPNIPLEETGKSNYYNPDDPSTIPGPTDTGHSSSLSTDYKINTPTNLVDVTDVVKPTTDDSVVSTSEEEVVPTNIEDGIHNAYVEAEKNTGDNRTSGSVAGSAVSDNGVNNNKKAGQFLNGSHTSVKTSESMPGYSLL